MSKGEADAIEPVQIEHSIDEIWDSDRLEQRYNFLDYHFERDGCYCRARSYADEFHSVALFGPFERRGSIRKVSSPDFERDVLLYLERRFRKVSSRSMPCARCGRQLVEKGPPGFSPNAVNLTVA